MIRKSGTRFSLATNASVCAEIMLKSKSRWRSDAREHQFRPQAPDRCVVEREAAAIEGSEVDHDRKAEPGARLGFIEPLAPPGNLRALRSGQSAAVVIDDDPQPRSGAGLHRPLDLHLDRNLRR